MAMSMLTARRGTLAAFRSSRVLTQTRSFWNVSLPVLGGPGGAHITKYHIVRPGKDGVTYDDFLLALPERDHLASFTKEVPLFIRYLKVVTDQEQRPEAFSAFLERAKSGLVVESDVFISTEELLALMWKNGYSDSERNAVQFTFPADYKFHYPELSVMFDIVEEDTYKFCMRTRMEKSHIGELDWAKVKPQGMLRNHWLIFGTGLFIFKSFPFFSYYFGVKVFGTGMWCWTMWSLMSRMIAKVCRRNEYMAAQKTAQDVMDGEDAIVESMKRFANDAKCVEYLKTFKEDTESKMGVYRKALVMKMKDDLSERATKQLQAIASFEASMGSAMQELVVKEAAASFKEMFPKNKPMQDKAFACAVQGLAGGEVKDDPVSVHFQAAFKSLQGVDLATVKGNAAGSLPERVAFAQQAKELEFQSTFMVTAQEAEEVRAIATKAKSGASDYDFSKLPADAVKRLEALYTSINQKVGYSMPTNLGTKPIGATSDSTANSYVENVNGQLTALDAKLQEARLKAFVAAF
ncbi:unnamed protein product [Polarella glacialis]|uniref:Uncharacterized protein n=1 Tax=Polarella glacialis TaxID=89957 RepID=A0A813JNS1_POLGL|nr:unnamed protein product [Polarella glacialis]